MTDTQWHVLLLIFIVVLATIAAVAFHGFERRLAELAARRDAVLPPVPSYRAERMAAWKARLPGHETTVFRRDSN